MNVFVSELAVLIDDEERALGNAIVRAISAISFGHLAFRMKVAEKIVGKSAETLGPSGVAGNAVNLDAQHLSIIAREAFEVGLVRGHLRRSNWRPGKRIKRDDYIFLATEIRELHLFVFREVTLQFEIRGHLSNFRH